MRRGLLLLGGVLAPLLAACAINPPRIVSISPSREAQDVPTNQPISIAFDRSMNHDSVESRFQLSPVLPGCSESKDCGFAWNGNTMLFTHPHVNFALSTTYSVSLRAGYADASGQRNTLDHSWRFATENRPTLSSVDPSDNASGVGPDRNIVLSFSRPMQRSSVQQAVQLTPDTPFLLRSRPGGDGSQYELIPMALLQPNQSYTVSVDQPLDLHGNALFGRLQTRFKTGPLSVSRKVGYLVGQRSQPATAVGIVDPHADPFLGRSTPKLVYRLDSSTQVTDSLLSFDWSPDGQRLAVVQAPKTAPAGAIHIVDLASGAVSRLTITGSDVYWSQDGSIVYLSNGNLRRYAPASATDGALTDPADGRVVAPLALSPDGRSVAYSTIDALGLNHLWIMNLDLRSRYRPVGLSDPADHPAWSPNGSKLAFRRITTDGPEQDGAERHGTERSGLRPARQLRRGAGRLASDLRHERGRVAASAAHRLGSRLSLRRPGAKLEPSGLSWG
jgi:hypothetical protein